MCPHCISLPGWAVDRAVLCHMQKDEGGEWELIRTDAPIAALELQALQKQGVCSCCYSEAAGAPCELPSALAQTWSLSPLSAEAPEKVSPADPLLSQNALMEVLVS